MTASRWVEPVSLEGGTVLLTPLAPADADGLREAVRDGDLGRLWVTAVPLPEQVDDWLSTALDQRERLGWMPFTVRRRSDGVIVGATRYMNVVPEHRRLEIGSTWYRASVQRSAVNTEAKLLLLGHAFDALGCHGVELRTHFMNQASRRAIERLGAKLDGVLRSHMVLPDGTLRDTCVYSIVAHEWPAVRANLRSKLARASGRPG